MVVADSTVDAAGVAIRGNIARVSCGNSDCVVVVVVVEEKGVVFVF